jgi:hypothetical protein
MALPTAVKTHQYDVNVAYAALGTTVADYRRLLRGIKNSLKGFASNAWTVVGSSNGTTAGLDASDRWAADTDLVQANSASPHSWIVLKQAQISANYQICIDINSTQPHLGSVIWSPAAGFTGGTTSARPTATDEQVLQTVTAWCGGSSSTQSFRIHAMQSSDGQITRIVGYINNVPLLFWKFDKPANPVSGWTTPATCSVKGGTNLTDNVMLVNTYTNGSPPPVKGRVSTAMDLYMTCEGYKNLPLNSAQSVPNDLDGTYPILPIGLASETSLHRGRHGTIFDLYFGLAAAQDADTYPADASKAMVQMGDFIFHWNGTTLQTT